MDITHLLLLLLVAGICGGIAQSLIGYSHSGCLGSIATWATLARCWANGSRELMNLPASLLRPHIGDGQNIPGGLVDHRRFRLVRGSLEHICGDAQPPTRLTNRTQVGATMARPEELPTDVASWRRPQPTRRRGWRIVLSLADASQRCWLLSPDYRTCCRGRRCAIGPCRPQRSRSMAQ